MSYDWLDKLVMFSICAALWALTTFISVIIWLGVTGNLKEPCTPPPPVESIPIDKEWNMEPIPVPHSDTITSFPGNLLRKEF